MSPIRSRAIATIAVVLAGAIQSACGESRSSPSSPTGEAVNELLLVAVKSS
jgi:FlaG/FlaF family flagellin (archaellin)